MENDSPFLRERKMIAVHKTQSICKQFGINNQSMKENSNT
jgi:hypothetical protein